MPDELRKWLNEHAGESLFYEILTSGEVLDLVKDDRTLEVVYDSGSWTYNVYVGLKTGYRKQLKIIFTGPPKVVVYYWETQSGDIERSWYITK